MNVGEGDIIFVHSSWRSFIGFDLTPQDFIDLLLELVGEQGTILMPSYGYKNEVFDVKNTKSSAGIITEIFRKNENVIRSNNPQFSVSAKGKDAKILLSCHEQSKFAFDQYSPYYLALEKNAKILLVGLGKKPHKHSIFHCATYFMKNTSIFYENVFNYEVCLKYIIDDNIFSRTYIDRKPEFQNDKKNMRKAYQKISPYVKKDKIGYLDLAIYDAQKAFDIAIEMEKENSYLYKKN